MKPIAQAGMIILFLFLGACSPREKTPGLVSTSVMGTLRGMHYSRVITHFHTPYSFDACDSKGLDGSNTPAQWCLDDIREGLCDNHINFVFTSDHASHMAEVPFQSLLLLGPQDTTLNDGGGNPIANVMFCYDGHRPILSPGLEGQLLALGMEHHAIGNVATLTALYGGEDATTATTISTQTNAMIAIPHTESRDLSLLQTLSPAAIEIYNVHANLDPKIRKKWLDLKPFDHIGKFLNYLVDPFRELNADFLFMEFVEYAPIYMQKWNALLAQGIHSTGIGGLDSHENIFAQKASDGERLDHHRRMLRFMNNLVMTTTDTPSAILGQIQSGLSYFVLEGLGTPIGLDFHGLLAGTTIVEMGSTMTVGAQTSSLIFKIPSVYSEFPGMKGYERPSIYAELHYINASAIETVVARSTADAGGGTLTYNSPPAGNYRVHVYMTPHHLRQYIFNQSLADQPFQWIITNPILVN